MAYTFGDGFDLYVATADAVAGYWDSGTTTNSTIVAGRFAGGQAWSTGSNNSIIALTKSSGANDAVHHFVLAFRQSAALTGTSLGCNLQLLDGTTAQCSIVFRSDGAVLLTSGTPAGAVLATYTGAVSAQNTWFAFEFEVIISPTAGRFRARKNGNASDDFDSGATLNTRPGANTYANKLQFSSGPTQLSIGANQQVIDDLLWRSDAASVPWVGDIRCYTRMPASDVSAQFARVPSPAGVSQTTAQTTTTSKVANAGMMSAFVATFSGTIAAGQVSLLTGGTGNMKAAIYDATRTTVLATSNAVVNPVNGSNAITFGTLLTVTKGVTYHLAVDQDTTLVYNVTGANQFTFTTTYASFPAASPSTSVGAGPVFTLNITPTVSAEYVNETLQDAATTYVYDSVVGHSDLYTIAALAATPASVVAVTTRGYVQKSDAGTRNGAVQLKSGATTVQSTSTALSTSWQWLWRTDATDPATGAAWTPTAVNNVTVGPVVTA